MLCNKCGNENSEESIFCGNCGARIDGKKECRSCGKMIDEKNDYCNFCGARTDGKNVCSQCGAVYDENFCPQCGASAAKTPAQKAAKAYCGEAAGYKRVLDIVKISLIFASAMCLLIFSFFVGPMMSMRSNSGGGKASISTSFYFLITQFKEISAEIDGIIGSVEDIYGEFYAGLYLPTVFTAVAVGINIIVCLVFGIVAIVKFVNHFKNNQPVKILNCVLVPSVTTLAAYAAVMSLAGMTLSGFANLKLTLNATSITNIVLVSVLMAGAATLQLVIDGKKTLQRGRLMKYILLSLTAVFTLVALVIAGKSVVTIDGNAEGVGSMRGKLGPMTFFTGIMTNLGLTSTPTEKLQTIATYSTATAVIYMVFFLLLCILLYFVLNELTSEKGYPKSMFLAISAFAISIGYLVVSVLLNNQLLGTIGGSPIVALIMCAFALAGTITWYIQWLMLKKER